MPLENVPSRVLIRAPNPVGDLVMATGSFASVRRAFPRAEISLLLKPGRADVLDGGTDWDDLVVDDSHLGFGAFRRLVGTLRGRGYDLAILYTHSVRSAAAIAFARVRERVGHAKGGQSLFLTKRVRPVRREDGRWKPVPMPTLYAGLATAAGAPPIDDGRPRLAVPSALEDVYRERRSALGIDADERLVGIVPGAAFGASKLWPAERIAAVADEVSRRHDVRTIVFSGPGEDAIVDRILGAMSTRAIDPRPARLGLALLKPFVRDLRLLLTMDTGPRHYATAFRVPTLCIMGPTDPAWTASHLDRQVVLRRDVPCGPCHKPVCPLDHACMTSIAPGDVLEAIEDIQSRWGIFG